MERNSNISLDKVQEFIKIWNYLYPIDRWWRQKHEIAFNSPDHRSMTFIDMRIELEEERYIGKLKEKREIKYKAGEGNYLMRHKDIPMTEEEIDEAFDNIDLSKFNDKETK